MAPPYALGLGLSNGDLFRGVMAFSLGIIPHGVVKRGTPRIFLCTGTNDQILPIDECSRRLAPQLKQAGYGVKFQSRWPAHGAPEIVRGRRWRGF